MSKATTSVRASLEAIRQRLKRCLRYPSIYHELWEPQAPVEKTFPDIWKPKSMSVGNKAVVVVDVPDVSGIGESFRKANDFDVPYGWEWWHEPNGARYFGCFYGDSGAGWDGSSSPDRPSASHTTVVVVIHGMALLGVPFGGRPRTLGETRA